MIDVMKTRLGETLRKAKLLNDSVAWLEANDVSLRTKIVREWIQKGQLIDQGVDSNGEIIGFYSLATEFFTDGKKKEGDPYDLELTGDFYRSMFVRVLSDAIIIDGDYEKMSDQHWWKLEILNLTDENLQRYIDEIRRNYIRYARKILALD